MQKEKSSYNEKFSVDVVKMIRNNNIVTGSDKMEHCNTYFMLDYFDLMFHRNLVGDEKIYREFWNIRDNQDSETFSYKAAYKTLSLYASEERTDKDFFKVEGDEQSSALSFRPFLGIVQVDLVYSTYSKKPSYEEVLLECERQILECLKRNVFYEKGTMCYQIHRSSTSGDFCLAVKSAFIQDIYKISSIINNFTFSYSGETFRFSTYTNIGIECFKDGKGCFYTFQEDTVKKNTECRFALRITTRNSFAKNLFQSITEKTDMSVVIEPIEGLFGRYDFLIILSMEDFSKLYSILCESKIVGSRKALITGTGDKFLDSFQKGVVSGDIEIINERVLVPLADEMFELASAEDDYQENRGNNLKDNVEKENQYLQKQLGDFQQMISLFFEERRAFIDVSRELGEVISTYAPQGVEYDSHVNWQILVNDLSVVFAGINAWKKSYEAKKDTLERKAMRVQFITEIRLVTEALNQYYKFLQNVNAQTWQAPLYEIQTQLDAEKMMIAYREFLYQYLQRYRKHYEDTDDIRPMQYPIIYPDLLAEKVCVVVAFQNAENLYKQLFVCKVPSFEYYGRMFDMIPWSMHEASHSIRVLPRKIRNEYIVKAVFWEVFSQAFYHLLNKYTNDYGYHGFGELENDVVECIVQSAVARFENFCSDRNELTLNYLETELLEFLNIIFEQNIKWLERRDDTANVEGIQKALLHFIGKVGLLDAGEREKGDTSWKDMVEQSANQADVLFELFKEIYQAFYWQMMGMNPEKDEWEIVISRDSDFEEKLQKVSERLEKSKAGREQIRDYCFNMRELKRLYGAWYKLRKEKNNGAIRDGLWQQCIQEIRKKMREGFHQNKGFPELYRILNLIFDSGEDVDDVQNIGKEFDCLLQEEARLLTERVIKLYRETAADIFMTETLGLNAFGYCRHMFQTVSDASVGNSADWTEAINVHRFRAVAAVLLNHEPGVEVSKFGKTRRISMKGLLTEGEKFCHFTLDCAKEKINIMLEEERQEEKKAPIKALFELLNANIENIFKVFTEPMIVVHEALEDSALALMIDPKRFDEDCTEEIADKRQLIKEKYEKVKDEVQKFAHIFYRVRCFISILDLVGEKGYIVIEEEEYQHFNLIYQEYGKICQKPWGEEICRVVSEYYNTPQSAMDKSSAEMLEDTLRFIQTYYYRNRFNMMSSLQKNKGEEGDEETGCS